MRVSRIRESTRRRRTPILVYGGSVSLGILLASGLLGSRVTGLSDTVFFSGAAATIAFAFVVIEAREYLSRKSQSERKD